jgi:hypothetical protein
MKKKRGLFFGCAALLTAALLIFAGCGDTEGGPAGTGDGPTGGGTFVAVTDITNVPATGTVGIAVNLSGATVEPATATNQAIMWNVKTPGAGVTGITGRSFTPTETGTVVLTATITNGATASSAYTKDFTITVSDSATFVAVTDITGVPETGTVGTAVDLSGAMVVPSNATNQAIVWSVKTPGAGVTTITGSGFTPTGTGTVTLTATIANGATASTSYTKDFTINVTPSYAIGDIGPGGGIIFYISAQGFSVNGSTCHYLEAAPVDLGSRAWGSPSDVNTSDTAIGTGQANTAVIIAAQGIGTNTAAQLCDAYNGGGKTDWFLPSKDELNAMYQKRTFIGSFGTDIYWSSSEIDSTYAWVQNLIDGSQSYGNKPYTGGLVRAVRAF